MSIGGGLRYRADGRTPGQMRPVSVELGVQKWAAASLVYRQGDTHVLCAATVEDRIPPHLRGKGTGWVTAEYAMLPAATSERMQRESVKGRPGGRTYEIQRLVGRALRGVVDTSAMGERTVTIDCDVLQADGGTRCASITGGYIALVLALRKAGLERALTSKIAAISVGIVADTPLLDLEYTEDLRGGGRLQRGGHGCRHLRRAAGHRGGQALRSGPDGPCCRSPMAASRSSSPSRTRSWGDHERQAWRADLRRHPEPLGLAPAASGRRLLLATRAHHKVRELQELLDLPGVMLLTPDEVGIDGEPVEDADTFDGDAKLKARYYAVQSVLPTLADDSGLEVDALDGRPGVYTRRYAGPDATDVQNNAMLLAELDGVAAEQRGARYQCVLAFLDPRDGPRWRSGFLAWHISWAVSPPIPGATAASATTPSSSRRRSRREDAPWAR